jgi:hypothetical protein
MHSNLFKSNNDNSKDTKIQDLLEEIIQLKKDEEKEISKI